MIDRIPGGPRTIRALYGAAALFAVVLVLLAVQMAQGHDPALGRSSAATTTQQDSTATPDTSGSGDDWSSDDSGSATQQQSQQAPLQSTTS